MKPLRRELNWRAEVTRQSFNHGIRRWPWADRLWGSSALILHMGEALA